MSANHHRHGYAIVRSLILAVSSLAIIGVLFAVYQYSSAVQLADVAEEMLPEELADIALPDSATPVVSIESMYVGAGGAFRNVVYDPKTKQPRLEFSGSAWRPLGEPQNGIQEIEVDNPDIRVEMPDGQRVRTVARRGVLAVRGVGKPEPIRGTLIGDVRMDIDRLTREQRDALPESEHDPEPDDIERLIFLRFEDVSFDMEASRMETANAFSVRLVEGEISGVGMMFVFNEADRRVEELEFMEAGKLIIRAGGEAFSPILGADGDKPESDANTVPAQGHQADEDNEGDTSYLAELTGEVRIATVDSHDGAQVFSADRLSLLFLMPRIKASEDATADGQDSDGEKSERASKVKSPEKKAEPSKEVVITWTGDLRARPEEVLPASRHPSSDRVQVLAEGNVRVTDANGSVACDRLELHQDSKRVWITAGESADNVMLSFPDQGSMRSPAIFVDGTANVIHIDGPAVLSGGLASLVSQGQPDGQQSSEEVHVRFSEGADLQIAQHALEVPGRSRPKLFEYIARAEFRGDVMFRRSADTLAADEVIATFDAPTTDAMFSDRLATLEAAGGVLLTQDTARVTCDDLAVVFDVWPDGRSMPHAVEATGNVFVKRDTLSLSAERGVTLSLVPLRRPGRVFSPLMKLTEWFAVLGEGRDPSAVDWEKRRQDIERDHYEFGIERVEAHGGVLAYDSAQGLDISAETLTAELDEQQSPSFVRLTGPSDRMAFVQFQDYTISANQIEADLERERIDVFGAGKAEFVTARGLDGRQLDKPQNINMSWSKSLAYRGGNNTARLLGDVKAVSRRRVEGDEASLEVAQFNAQEMVIDFIKAERAKQVAASDEAADVFRSPLRWLVGVMLNFSTGIDAPKLFAKTRPVDRDATVSPAGDWWVFSPVALALSGPVEDPASRPVQFDRQPTYLVALRDVVVVFSNTDDTGYVMSRARLAGEKLTADLRTQLLTVPVAGSLLIEDYTQRDVDPASVSRDPLLTDVGRLPSQTFIKWADSFTFHADRNRADFRQDVMLDHRAGSEMLLARERLADEEFDAEKSTLDGRNMRLDCGDLMVEFAPGDDGKKKSDIGGLSMQSLSQLEAARGVLMTTDDFTLNAARVVKYVDSDLLRIVGGSVSPAEIFSDLPNGPRYRGPEFNYNLKTGEVEAPELILGGRSRSASRPVRERPRGQ